MKLTVALFLATTTFVRGVPTMIDFDTFTPGDFVGSLGSGVTARVHRVAPNSRGCFGGPDENLPMIFDSGNPTGDDFDLGTPNAAFGGPGIGEGQGNDAGLNNVLIVSEDCNQDEPDDNARGGVIVFEFDTPRLVDSVGLLDVEEEGSKVTVLDAFGDKYDFLVPGLGDNSVQTVSLEVEFAVQVKVRFPGSGAVTHLAVMDTEVCVPARTIAFDTLAEGSFVGAIDDGLIEVSVSNAPCAGPDGYQPMVFNTAKPTGDDSDLGSPNKKCGTGDSKGVGEAGVPGKTGENCDPLGHVLIVSEDCDSADPDDSMTGGTIQFDFATPTTVYKMGFLDQEKKAKVIVTTSSGAVSEMVTIRYGDNSFQLVNIDQTDVVRIEVIFRESGAITSLIVENTECL